jgi:hypothetical protein
MWRLLCVLKGSPVKPTVPELIWLQSVLCYRWFHPHNMPTCQGWIWWKQSNKDSTVLKHFEIRTVLCLQQLPKSGLERLVFEVRDVKHTLYSSPSIARIIKCRIVRWAGHVARIWDRRGVYRVSVGKPGRPRFKREEYFKMDLQKVGWVGMVWIQVALDRDRWQSFVNAVMNLRVP